ncbi:hypothetical protein [Streptomyces sp. NPDC054958]
MTEPVIDLASGIYERQAREWELYEVEAAHLAETEPPQERPAPTPAPVGYLVPDPPPPPRPWEPQPEKYRRLMIPR